MSNPADPRLGSGNWQPEYLAQHQGEQSQYLEKVASTSLVQQVAAAALHLLALQPGQRVLEVGCGSGVFLPLLTQAVGPQGFVAGIDHAAGFVAEAQARTTGLSTTVQVQEASAYALPFESGSFDAAHCERVLMHLDRPDDALREMARVVRPGGWVVAAEPDWGGIRIDHPDRSTFDPIYARALTQRHPDMGLSLYRRMGAVGLEHRVALPVMAVMTDYGLIKMYGLMLSPAADALVSEGQLEPQRAVTALAELDDAQSAGRFYSAGLIHVVAGRVPG